MHTVSPFELSPSKPLTQVVFVHDYVQFIFETETLSIYGRMRYRGLEGDELEYGQPGFADALAGLIGAKASSVSTSQAECLALQFEEKGRLAVTHESTGPEAFQFVTEAGVIVVQQNI